MLAHDVDNKNQFYDTDTQNAKNSSHSYWLISKYNVFFFVYKTINTFALGTKGSYKCMAHWNKIA